MEEAIPEAPEMNLIDLRLQERGIDLLEGKDPPGKSLHISQQTLNLSYKGSDVRNESSTPK